MKNLLMVVAFLGMAFATTAQTPVACNDGGPCWSPAKFEATGAVAFAFDKTPVSTTIGGGGDLAYFPLVHSTSLVRNLGLAADFYYTQGSYSKTGSENLFTAMAGPRYRVSLGDGWQLFGQSLFGVSHENFAAAGEGPRVSTTRGSYLLGGGLDAQFSQHFSIRFIDYAYEDTFSQQQKHNRISMGVKFSF